MIAKSTSNDQKSNIIAYQDFYHLLYSISTTSILLYIRMLDFLFVDYIIFYIECFQRDNIVCVVSSNELHVIPHFTYPLYPLRLFYYPIYVLFKPY